ncbi:MAG: hypothetical protein ACJ8LI_04650 [Chthoniobacterales bacterium]
MKVKLANASAIEAPVVLETNLTAAEKVSDRGDSFPGALRA